MKILSVKVSNEVLQWIGALAIIAGHGLNSLGVAVHQDRWNILAFMIGTICFFIWSARVANKPQLAVNIVALTICVMGLYNSLKETLNG